MIGAWVGLLPIVAHADYLSDARAALKKGDLRTAQIELRNAVRGDPQNAEAHYWLGRVSLELGDTVAAEREASAARDRGFDPRQSVPLLGRVLLAQGKYDDLLARLQPDGKDKRLDAAILVARGYAEIGLKRPDEAAASFAAAEQDAPEAVEPLLADARLAIGRGDLAGAAAKIDQAIAAQPKSADALLAKAELLRLKGDVPAGIAVLDGLISDQPGVLAAHLTRAQFELAAGKNDAARTDIDTVLKAQPGNLQATYLLAITEAQSGKYQAADADLAQLSRYADRLQRYYFVQAMVKARLGQNEQAEQAAGKYLARAPNDLAAYKLLARIQLAKQRPDQAADTLSKIADTGKADAELYDMLGSAYAATGRGTEAIAAFRKAEALAPNDVGVQTRMASVRLGMGDPDAAVGDLEHTLKLAPNAPAVGEALFFAALATGDNAKAADALAKIHAAEGDTASVDNLDGLLKLSEIDFSGAKAVFSGLVRKYPNFGPAKINLARLDVMMGDRAAGEALLADVLAAQPTVQPALSMLTSAYVQSNRLPDAIALLQRAHAAAPASTPVTVALGEVYIRAGSAQKALDLAAAQTGNNADAVNVDTVNVEGLKAAAYQALGRKKEARDSLEQILKINPGAVEARRQLVALLVQAGEFEGARSVVSAGIAANPGNYQLYQDYVLIDLKSGGIAAALATADRLRSENQGFPALDALRGDIYLAANRPADAATAYTQANDAAPSGLLVGRLAATLLRSGRAADAEALLRDWLGKHGDDMAATEQASEVAIAAGKYGEATNYLETLLKRKPHDPVALNNLAWVYQQQGNQAKARALARQAYVLAPNPTTADTLGWIMTTSGDAQGGVALLRQASAGGSDPRIRYHYAVALKDTGNALEARKQLERVVENKASFKEKDDAQKMLNDLGNGT